MSFSNSSHNVIAKKLGKKRIQRGTFIGDHELIAANNSPVGTMQKMAIKQVKARGESQLRIASFRLFSSKNRFPASERIFVLNRFFIWPPLLHGGCLMYLGNRLCPLADVLFSSPNPPSEVVSRMLPFQFDISSLVGPQQCFIAELGPQPLKVCLRAVWISSEEVSANLLAETLCRFEASGFLLLDSLALRRFTVNAALPSRTG
jgi:hypothetical protein